MVKVARIVMLCRIPGQLPADYNVRESQWFLTGPHESGEGQGVERLWRGRMLG